MADNPFTASSDGHVETDNSWKPIFRLNFPPIALSWRMTVIISWSLLLLFGWKDIRAAT